MSSSGGPAGARPRQRTTASEEVLAELLAGVAAGDEAALADLFTATHRWVRSTLRRILGQPEAVEEVVQDVYWQVWRTAGRYRTDRAGVAAWLMIITRSRAVDRLRRLRSRVEREDRVPVEAAQAASFGTPEPDPAARHRETESRHSLRRALDALPVEQRDTVKLAYLEGMTHTEIADRLGQPVGTIKTRIRLGMNRLRAQLVSPEANR